MTLCNLGYCRCAMHLELRNFQEDSSLEEDSDGTRAMGCYQLRGIEAGRLLVSTPVQGVHFEGYHS